jgi:hypothetical protein
VPVFSPTVMVYSKVFASGTVVAICLFATDDVSDEEEADPQEARSNTRVVNTKIFFITSFFQF